MISYRLRNFHVRTSLHKRQPAHNIPLPQNFVGPPMEDIVRWARRLASPGPRLRYSYRPPGELFRGLSIAAMQSVDAPTTWHLPYFLWYLVTLYNYCVPVQPGLHSRYLPTSALSRSISSIIFILYLISPCSAHAEDAVCWWYPSWISMAGGGG